MDATCGEEGGGACDCSLWSVRWSRCHLVPWKGGTQDAELSIERESLLSREFVSASDSALPRLVARIMINKEAPR